jgi:hypothetical protein
LFRGQLQRDLAEAAPDHHLEDVAVLERLGAAGAARELDWRFRLHNSPAFGIR